MSYKATDWAMDLVLDDPHEKLVLLALAYHHNRDTGQCNPSVPTIAQRTGMSDRGVRYAIKRLCGRGLVSVCGQTNRRQYDLAMSVTAAPPAGVARETPALPAATAAREAGEENAAPASCATVPAKGAGNSGIPCSQSGKDQGNNRGGGETPTPDLGCANVKTVPHRLPQDWQPSPADIEYAERQHRELDWRREAAAFRDYWLASAQGLRSDWSAMWRRWLDKAWRFAGDGGGQGGGRRGGQYGNHNGERNGEPRRSGEPWEQRVKSFLIDGDWLSQWGAPPGAERGCRVPKDVLERCGYGNAPLGAASRPC